LLPSEIAVCANSVLLSFSHVAFLRERIHTLNRTPPDDVPKEHNKANCSERSRSRSPGPASGQGQRIDNPPICIGLDTCKLRCW
jgi:hypothetical protein